MFTVGPMTCIAGEALEKRRRVKIQTPITSPPTVVYADAGEVCIGTTEFAAAADERVTVRPFSEAGIHEVTAAGAFDGGAVLYGANDGKVDDVSNGSAQFIAWEAAGADGDIVGAVPWPVVATTAATVSILDSGGFTDAATVEAALAEIFQNALSAQASILVPLGAITQEDGTALTKQAGTTAGFAQVSNKEVVIDIPVNCDSGESLQFSVPIPQDLDDSADITVHALVGKDADNDALTLDCEVYPCAVGDTQNDDIQDTAAQTITQAASELVFTCGADGVLAAPGTLSVILSLGGTNDGDAVYIYGAWIEYTRKILTS